MPLFPREKFFQSNAIDRNAMKTDELFTRVEEIHGSAMIINQPL